MHIPLIGSIVGFFYSIKKIVGNLIYLLLATNILLSIFEGIGIALVIPLFFALDSNKNQDSDWLRFTKSIFDYCQIEYSISRFFILVLSLFLISRIFVLVSYLLDAKLYASAQTLMYQKSFKAIEKMDFPFFSKNNSGYFNNLIQNETMRAIVAIQYFTRSMNNLVMAIIMFLIAFYNNFIFSATVLVFTGLIFYSLKKFSSETKKLSYQLSSESGEFQSRSMELFNNFKYLISTNGFDTFLPLLNKASDNLIQTKYKMKVLTDRLVVFTVMCIIPILAGVIYVFIEVCKYPVETILVSIIICQRALTKSLSFQGIWQQFNNFLGSFKFFTKNLLKISENYERRKGEKIAFESIKVEFNNVEFSIDSNFKLIIPQLLIPKNKIISIVGVSGSGKSTLLDLITGVYIPQKGQVHVNDKDLSAIDLENYRSHIGFVSQDSSVFNDTIFNYISSWATPNFENVEKVKMVSQLSNINDLIENLALKYEALIGDKGVNLSGGQMQRLALARELFKNPLLLLLDEATSGLDSESEFKIIESIEKLRGKMTIIIIAHRLSTVKKSDMIFVMESGCIIENGNYEELINRDNSRFKDLVFNQLLKE